MKAFAILFSLCAMFPLHAEPLNITRNADAIVIKDSKAVVSQYQLKPPVGSKLSVESGCYFHPVTTPNGVVVTEVAPSDHPHHRGIFLAWVEMHGKADADFWGWGEHAPKKDRRIVNRDISDVLSKGDRASFTAKNEWLAESDVVIAEQLQSSVRREAPANILDLTYTITAGDDVTLSRWAFSGFCVRVRKDGKLQAEGPDGPVMLANPKHTEPASDWPAARWYGYTLTLADGTVVGAAVLDHPKNPPSLWHNHRDVRMLNPCIVAPAAVTLKAGVPLVLRYAVVVYDGSTPRPLLEKLAKEWAR
jgi:hypothetical protein